MLNPETQGTSASTNISIWKGTRRKLASRTGGKLRYILRFDEKKKEKKWEQCLGAQRHFFLIYRSTEFFSPFPGTRTSILRSLYSRDYASSAPFQANR